MHLNGWNLFEPRKTPIVHPTQVHKCLRNEPMRGDTPVKSSIPLCSIFNCWIIPMFQNANIIYQNETCVENYGEFEVG